LFQDFASLQSDEQGLTSLEKLRKKVTHDIEHQIQDMLNLRDFVSKKTSLEVEKIELPKLRTTI